MDSSVKTIITRDDVIKAGACSDGVFDWCEENDINATALKVKTILKIADEDEHVYIKRAANLSGDGNGYGYGDGDGDGYGYGNGYGYGDGDGDGYGYGP